MFGLKRKKEDHIVVPPEEGVQGGVGDQPRSADPYHEAITDADLAGIAPAKQEAPVMMTPLDEVNQTENPQETPQSTGETTPSQFVVGEVPSVPTAQEEVLSQETPLDQVAAPQEPSLEQLKQREAVLEAHFAEQSAVDIQREQKAQLVQKAEQAFAQGKSPVTFNTMVGEMERDIRSLEQSAAQVAREAKNDSLPQGEKVGAVYQEAQQAAPATASPTPVFEQRQSDEKKIPGVGNTSGVSLPGYKQKENLQTSPSINRDGQIARTELQPQAETLLGQNPEMTPKAAKGAIEMAYRQAEIAQTQSFDQLYAAIDTVTEFRSSVAGIYAREELKDLIEAVRTGDVPVNVITRTGGLRAKVLELMSQEMNQQEQDKAQAA